jgi:hypothetical protein
MKFRLVSSARAMAIALLLAAQPGNAMELDPDKGLHDWQVRRLMQPSPQELERERMGSVYIYDGLTDREVEIALDKHFGRIEHMMFVGTVNRDAGGEPMHDGVSAQYVAPSGGCDE